MGMTIDEHIEVLKSYHHGFTGYAGDLQNSINVAIDTMRKYQKIEDIVRDYYNEQYTDKLDIEIIEMISEVLCDGNDV